MFDSCALEAGVEGALLSGGVAVGPGVAFFDNDDGEADSEGTGEAEADAGLDGEGEADFGGGRTTGRPGDTSAPGCRSRALSHIHAVTSLGRQTSGHHSQKRRVTTCLPPGHGCHRQPC
jgi:hypothetical protein